MPFKRKSILLVEDDEIWVVILTHYIEKHKHQLAGVARNYDDALKLIEQCGYDVLILDINLHGKNEGLELAQIASERYKKPFIIISGNELDEIFEHSIKAKPVAYLTKPFNEASLSVALNNVKVNIVSPAIREFIYIKTGNSSKKILWADVTSLTVEKNYVRLRTAERESGLLLRGTLLSVWTELVPETLKAMFFKISRSEVIHLKTVVEIKDTAVKTHAGSFQISRTMLKALKLALLKI
jgi:DNA-binding LytR/AlgR family response regulator